MPRPLTIIGTPSSAGAYAPGQEQAPAALRQAGLLARLSDVGREVVDCGDSPLCRWRPDRASRYAPNAAAVRDAVVATAARVQAAATAGQMPLVLGGDCTVGIGTVSGMLAAEPEPLGLLDGDLHADLNTPGSVPDGALDWMGMAHLLDELAALPELRQIGPRTPLLTPEQAVIVGHSHARHPLGARGHCPLPGEANVATLERLVAGLAEVLRELRAKRPANPAASPGI